MRYPDITARTEQHRDSLGQRFGKQAPLVAGAISTTDAAALVHARRTQGTVEITVADIGEVAITVDDVVITETPREGWAVVTEAGESVALDLKAKEGVLIVKTMALHSDVLVESFRPGVMRRVGPANQRSISHRARLRPKKPASGALRRLDRCWLISACRFPAFNFVNSGPSAPGW